ncbi:cysteine hydrolase [Polaromonas hydrogenivorans]|uniref:Cysteine hydrolase n=1 Tax=Polaromonas hydrogenivorans TaxID=335476 RepID=A0AAU7LXU5_9BURK
MKKNIQLLLIDPQNDFCDLPADWRPLDPLSGRALAPALPVAGAHEDMLRLAGLIREGAAGISAIALTLDSHHRFDIAHPTFWQTGVGGSVNPFTPIRAAQVRDGRYVPKDPAMRPRALAYLDALEQRGRYTLMVWPVHCEIGSWGYTIHPAVKAACNRWEDQHLAVVQKISKGSNPWTEHYSALQAEVPDAGDAATQLNRAFIAELDRADQIIIAGEASSHCVRATTEHLIDHLPSGQPGKVVLLTDCMSPVGGFEAQHQAFLADMASRGVRLATSAEILPALLNNA